MVEFRGRVEKDIYVTPDFSIYAIEVTDGRDKVKLNQYGNVTILGNLPILDFNTEYIIKGTEDWNAQYKNFQYKVKKIYPMIPKGVDETEYFLRKVLTPLQAQEVIKHYPNIIDLVMNGKEKEINTDKLYNIGKKRIKSVYKKIKEHYVYMELYNEFSDFDLSTNVIEQMYEKHGSAEKVIEWFYNNPYQSLCSLDRVGFKRADKMILKAMPDKINSYDRCINCVIYIVEQDELNGNTVMSLSAIKKELSKMAPETIDHLNAVVEDEVFIKVGNFIGKKETFEIEKYIAKTLIGVINDNNTEWTYDLDRLDGSLTGEQTQAVSNVLKHNISVLAGYAGSGKTHTTKTIVNILDELRLKYLLSSPTGKASKILSTYTDREATTIHRMLGYKNGGFEYNEKNKLYADLIIIDEFSMVDIDLFTAVLKAIDFSRTKLLLILDPAQIPSIGAGNIGYDIIQSKLVPVTTLTKIFRYGEGGLMNVATNVRNGSKYFDNLKDGYNPFGANKDYVFAKYTQESAIPQIIKLYKGMLDKGKDYRDIVITMAMNKGDYGTIAINEKIQTMLLKMGGYLSPSNPIKYGKQTYYIGDRVMQTKNNYTTENTDGIKTPIFNGNIGIIKEYDGKYIIIDFDGEMIVYTRDMLNDVSLAYAINFYKMQGSQSPYVIVFTPKAHTYMMNRNLLYTALTRTSKQCFHFGTERITMIALKKSITFQRNTLLTKLMHRLYLKEE